MRKLFLSLTLAIVGNCVVMERHVEINNASLYVNWTEEELTSASCIDDYPYGLDIGMYKVTMDMIKQKLDFQKICMRDSFADVKWKNTAYIVHGAQPGRVLMGERFAISDEEDFIQVVSPWIFMGWDVYVFMWTQFSDEVLSNFMRAEAKIWSTDWFVGMEYIYKIPGDEEHVHIGYDRSNRTVGEMLADSIMDIEMRYLEMLPLVDDNNKREIRVIGHSLGTQLTMAGAEVLLERGFIDRFLEASANHTIRLTLLDSVFSPYRQGYLMDRRCGATISENMGCISLTLHMAGVTVESYKTSFINPCIFSAKQETEIIDHIALALVKMNQWGDAPLNSCVIFDDIFSSSPSKISKNVAESAIQMYNQHVYAIAIYMISLVYPPRMKASPDSRLALSAAMPTREVYQYMDYFMDGEKQCFMQFDDGLRYSNSSTMTINPSDDLYELVDCNRISF